MSSSSQPGSGSQQRLARLNVTARDRAAQIVVIDTSLAPVARGIGSLSVELPLGIYKARVITGPQVREQFAVLAEQGPVQLEFPPIAFASPAPLEQTTKSHEYHMAAAHDHSRRVHVDLGGDSEIFLFLRDFTKPGEAPSKPAELCAGVKLTDEYGHLVVDFEATGARNGQGDAWYACNVALMPGIYRLVVETAGERLAQTIVASEHWQTQVFLLREPTSQAGARRVLNMAGASIFVVRRKEGFHPRQEDLRLIELARLGLANRRQILSREELDRLIYGKFENPMLGLFGAHLLLLSAPPDTRLLETMVRNLRSMLGEHPDVDALELVTGSKSEPPPLSHPPMLAQSYWLVIEQSAKRPELVPPGSVMAKIATQLWGGAGPWLLYSEPAPRSVLESYSPAVSWSDLPSMQSLIDQLRTHDLQWLANAPMELTSAEEAVLRYLVPPDKHRFPFRSGSGAAAAEKDFDQGRMVRMLGLPPAVLREAINTLLLKATQRGPPRRAPHLPKRQGRWAHVYALHGSSAGNPGFPQGVGRLERALLRCSRWQDKARAWAAVDRLEPQVKGAFFSRESLERMEQCRAQWRARWSEARSELETPASRARLASELPSHMSTSHTNVDYLLSTSRPRARLEQEPGLSLWEAYEVLESLLRRCRRELPVLAMRTRQVKRAEKALLTRALRTAFLGIKAMSAGLQMGERGASTYWLGSQAVQSIKEQFSD